MATGRIQPQIPVKSVADADCFGLVRFMAMNANTLGDYGSKSNIAFCQACGNAFIKREGIGRNIAERWNVRV